MTFFKSLVGVIGVLLIAGCGSNDKQTTTATTTPTTTSTIGGTAAKGIVQQGIVNAYTLSATGDIGTTSIGNAVTEDDGSYSLELSSDYDETSALLLELTSDDATTKMVCDALSGCGDSISRGDLFTPPDGFKLTTIIPSVSSDTTVNAQITPFTHIAAERIQENNEITTAVIAATTSQINQLVGVNILEIVPVDITDSEALSSSDANQQRYTIMLAALAEQAFEDNGDMVANLDAFAADFSEDGTFGDVDGLVMSDFLTAVNNEVTNSAADLDDAVETLITQHTTVIADAIDESGEFQPEETTGTGESDVARAKALITEIRTWKVSLENLENPADAFAIEARTILDTLNEDSNAVIEVLGRALRAAQTTIDNAIDAEQSATSNVTVYDREGQSMGVISIVDSSDTSSQGYTISASDIAGVSLNATINLNESLSSTELTAGETSLEVNADAANDNTKITFENMMFSVTLSESLVIDSDEEPKVSAISLKGGLKVEELSSGTPTGKSAMGNADIRLVALDDLESIQDNINLSLEKIALSDLTVSSDTGSTAGLSISLEMNNATSFDTFGYLNNESEVGFNLEIAKTDLNLENIESDFLITTFDNLYYSSSSMQTCASGYSSTGDYIEYSCQSVDIGNLIEQAQAYADIKYPQSYVSTSIDGIYFNSYENNFDIDGVLIVDDMETATSFLDATLNITGSLDLESHPEAILTLTVDKTGIDEGSFTATLGYDGKTLQILANTSNGTEEGTSADLTFTNVDGVVMNLNASSGLAVSGIVTVDDEEVGTIEESSSGIVLIRYNDGSFESL